MRYVKSSIGLQRLVHTKMIGDVSAAVGFVDTQEQLIPLLDALSTDSERAVRQHLPEQIVILARLCCSTGREEGYQELVEMLLPLVARLLEDGEAEVRQVASSALVDIASLVKPEDLGQHVLTIILRLSHDDDKEEMRMTACELLNSMSEVLGQDLCKQFVIPEVVSLAEDPVFRVRKATALNFHNVCKVGGEHELFERLMPAFVRLSKDEMYRVRRAVADSLSEISKYVSNDIRVGVLVEIYLRLSQDLSKLVKQSVLQQSGLFISTLPPRAVNELVLANYCSMVSGPTGDLTLDADLKYCCAYSFPAVLETIGAERWKELREVYRTLVQCPNPSVKQTLACSLHEVARILNDETLVKDELLPIFEAMIQELEVVQMGVIKNIANFLRMLSQPCRVSYLPSLHDILHNTNPFNWRLRQSLAVQLPDLLGLPAENDIFNALFPLVMTLLQDPVASVRKDSYRGVSKLIHILNRLSEKEIASNAANNLSNTICQQQLDSLIQAVNSLMNGDAYQSRILWVELAHQLLRDLPQAVFETYFVDGILQLTCDPVSNVRVAMGIFLGGWAPDDIAPWEQPSSSSGSKVSPWKWLMERADIKQCVQRLSNDDSDVYSGIVSLQPLFPDIKFKPMSVRGIKKAPGGVVPVRNSIYLTRSAEEVSTEMEIMEAAAHSVKIQCELRQQQLLLSGDVSTSIKVDELDVEGEHFFEQPIDELAASDATFNDDDDIEPALEPEVVGDANPVTLVDLEREKALSQDSEL